jgi:hypothetical protein
MTGLTVNNAQVHICPDFPARPIKIHLAFSYLWHLPAGSGIYLRSRSQKLRYFASSPLEMEGVHSRIASSSILSRIVGLF